MERLTKSGKEKSLEQRYSQELPYDKIFCRLFILEENIEAGKLVRIQFPVGFHFYKVCADTSEIQDWEVVCVEVRKDKREIYHFLIDGKEERTLDFTDKRSGISGCVIVGNEILYLDFGCAKHAQFLLERGITPQDWEG